MQVEADRPCCLDWAVGTLEVMLETTQQLLWKLALHRLLGYAELAIAELRGEGIGT